MLLCRIPGENEGNHEDPQFCRCAIRNSKEDFPNANQKRFFLSQLARYVSQNKVSR